MTMPTTLRDRAEIDRRLDEIAAELNRDYEGRTIDIVCFINSASMFCADLVRRLTVPVRIHPFGFSSYAKASASGEVRITLDLAEPMHDRHVLILEGIVVSGRTPKYLADVLALRKPASLAMCVLGVKKAMLAVELPRLYAMFELGSEIAVGYGVGEGPEKALPYLAAHRK